MSSPPDPAARIGARVRDLRVQRGLSQSALSRAAQIGKGSLSELEAGLRNPTIATLYALAGPLHVPLAALLDDAVGAEVSGDGLTAHLLDVRVRDGATVETYAMRFEPGTIRRSPAHGDGVVEHLVVTCGRLRLGPDDALQDVATGEHARFVADRPHAYEVVGDDQAEAVLVILTPPRTPSRETASSP
ncbi:MULTISPECIES: helix-turn-helix domain-containing protein [Mumia]|uniref:helix-turn-helix domain-containing protein n=1 Tax=Mumia TaxID=1546255 RepID=UPI00142174C7|nr:MULTISPECIES: XRE family transcriptional regulator [unclassified Mumia]QMW67565.1 helix-turn-helix transcriptional regulator [Mumia sp. ZJ1417]